MNHNDAQDALQKLVALGLDYYKKKQKIGDAIHSRYAKDMLPEEIDILHFRDLGNMLRATAKAAEALNLCTLDSFYDIIVNK